MLDAVSGLDVPCLCRSVAPLAILVMWNCRFPRPLFLSLNMTYYLVVKSVVMMNAARRLPSSVDIWEDVLAAPPGRRLSRAPGMTPCAG